MTHPSVKLPAVKRSTASLSASFVIVPCVLVDSFRLDP